MYDEVNSVNFKAIEKLWEVINTWYAQCYTKLFTANEDAKNKK